jgi:flagellar protein FlaJ
MYIEKKYRYMVYATCFIICFVVLGLFIGNGIYTPEAPYYIPIDQRVNNTISMCLLLVIFFPAVIEYNNARWLNGVERNIPILLRDITEDVKAGVPLLNALEDATSKDYGPVSKPLEETLVKFHLTSDLDSSLRWFGKKLKKPVANRMSIVLIEAYQTGGEITEVLDASVELFTDLDEFRRNRRSQTGPYVSIVYVGVFIFLLISWVLLSQFLQPLTIIGNDPNLADSGLTVGILDMVFYRSVMFWAAVMEALFGGLVAGKIREGRVTAGLIHTVFLLMGTITFYNLVIIG